MPDSLPYCPLCGNVNRADLGPVTGMCLDGRACRRRQAGAEPVNPDWPTPEDVWAAMERLGGLGDLDA